MGYDYLVCEATHKSSLNNVLRYGYVNINHFKITQYLSNENIAKYGL